MENVPRNSLFRILDAAINRATEGLRVLEDYQRMVLENPRWTRQLKAIRHGLVRAVTSIEFSERLQARDSFHDVGKSDELDSEYTRASWGDIVQANFSRVQQALRSIEEYSKVLDPSIAKQVETLRYEIYGLQKEFGAGKTSLTNSRPLLGSTLYVLVDGRSSLEEFQSLVMSILSAGVKLLQLRDKQLDGAALFERGQMLGQMTRDFNAAWIMNDRVDVALATRADGVHVGQDDLSLGATRQLVGDEMWIGVSTHDMEQARAAVVGGADYIGVGPTYPSTTKTFKEFAGLDFVSQVAQELTLPAFAIGGITPENATEVARVGLKQFAVQGAIVDAVDRQRQVQLFEDAVRCEG